MKMKLPNTNLSNSQFLKKITLLCTFLIFGFSFAQTYSSMSLHSDVDRVQPMTGIVFWSDNSSDLNTLGNKVQLEYSYLVYSDVIQEEGQYDWSLVDDLLAQVASNGRQAIIRFRYTYPGEEDPSVPNYIRNSSGYQDQYESVEGNTTYIPDWSSQELQDFTLEFFTEFAERYDEDPRLAICQIGFGSYAEYHLWSGPLTLGETFPSKDYQNTFLQHVNSVFNETQWSISIDAASSTYSPIASSSTLLNLNYGLFDDSFLHSEHSTSDSEYNRWCWLTFGSNRADDHIAGGELNYYSTQDQETVLDIEGPHGTTFEEMSEMYDISYMIGNDQLNYQSTSRIEDAAMATGYKFEVTAYTSNGSSTQVTIKNNGIAPIYYDAYPTVSGVKSSTSLKGLIAGESRSFTINTGASGEDLTISCDRLVSGQEIQFDANIDGGTVTTNTLTVTTPSTFSANGATQNITVTSNVDWSVSESSSWITLNTTSGSDNGTINVTASANTSTSSRSATITVSGSSITRNITISQAGADDTPVTSYTAIPALVQAEDYADKSDAPIAEDSQDTDNGSSMGWISANDYLSYNIDVPSSGEYTLDFRVASQTNGAQFNIYQGNSIVGNISSAATGGWYVWETVSTTVSLTAGEQTIKLATTNGGWNINWIAFNETTNTGNGTYTAIPALVQAENYTDKSDAPTVEDSQDTDNGSSMGWISTNDYLTYNIDVPSSGEYTLDFRVASATNGSQFDIYQGNSVIGSISSPATGDWYIWETVSTTVNLTAGDQTIKLAATGSGWNINWIEFNQETNASENCTAGTNLAEGATIVEFSDQQNEDNGVANAIDGDDSNRWSAEGFPQSFVIDLGDVYSVNQVNLMPFNDRAYQFRVQGSATSPDNGYSTLRDATSNTDGGSVITRTFDTYEVRYVRLTITGASGYTGTWSSIEDFEVICSGASNKSLISSIADNFDITAYPNPFTSSITVDASNTNQTVSAIQLVDLSGKVIASESNGTSINNLDDIASGMYLLQLLNAKGQIIAVEKVIK